MTTSADAGLAPTPVRPALIRTLIRSATVAGLTAGAWLAFSLSSTANAQSPLDDVNHVVQGVSASANQLVGGGAEIASPGQITAPVVSAAAQVVDEVADHSTSVVEDQVAPALDDVSVYAEPVLDDHVVPVLDDVSDQAEPVVEQAAEVVEPVLGDVADSTESVVEFVTPVSEPVVEMATPVVDVAAPVVDAAAPAGRVIEPVVGSVGQLAAPILQSVKQVVSPILPRVGQVVAPILSPVPVPITNPLRPAFALLPVVPPSSQTPAFTTPTPFAIPAFLSADFVEPGALAASGNRSGGGIPAAGALSAGPATSASTANRATFADSFARFGSDPRRHATQTATPATPADSMPSAPVIPTVPGPSGAPGCPVGTGNGATGSSSLQLHSSGPAADPNTTPAGVGGALDHDADLLARSDEPGTSPA